MHPCCILMRTIENTAPGICGEARYAPECLPGVQREADGYRVPRDHTARQRGRC